MPEGFAFPVNHELWMPLQLRPAGYAPLEGVGIGVFGLLGRGTTREHANAEFEALVKRSAATSPQTHQHLRPWVLAYGGRSAGSVALELGLTHVPILLVLIVASVTVAVLVYARTATRDAEIAMRYAIGASRGRIVSQLFVEALVLACVAAVVGLIAAHWALKLGRAAAYSAQTGGAPFWIGSGLRVTTVFYAVGLAVAAAAILGVLPALKATGRHVQAQLTNLGSGGSTLRFGRVWMAAMIGQVALTVIALPPALGIAGEGIRDRVRRSQFPTDEYLAVRIEVDREAGGAEESDPAYAARRERTYAEMERRIRQEPGVAAVAFGDRLPGMGVAVRRAEVEVTPGATPVQTSEMWVSVVGPGFFEAFDRAIVAGRDFNDGDRTEAAQTVIVNEAFARRRFMSGQSPIGRRVRYRTGDNSGSGPWFEIVGIARDIGMTPTDLGEAPYIYHPASAGAVTPLVMGVRIKGDRAAVAQRVRTVAAEIDSRIRIAELRPLDELARETDSDNTVAAVAIAAIVLLGLFLSAVGIFSMTSVSVARRTREIGLRSALGGSPNRILASIFAKAAWLVGLGVVAGNLLLFLLFAVADDQIPTTFLIRSLMITSGTMLTVGMLACIEPARRALRINPTEALRNL
jgi:predicted permease